MATNAELAAEMAEIKAGLAALMAAAVGGAAPSAPQPPKAVVGPTTDTRSHEPEPVWYGEGQEAVPGTVGAASLVNGALVKGMRFKSGNVGWHLGGEVWIPGYGYATVSGNVMLASHKVVKSPEQKAAEAAIRPVVESLTTAARQAPATVETAVSDMSAMLAKWGITAG